MTPDALARGLAERPRVMDAAMGTRLIARGLDPARDDASLWNCTRPGAVAALHAEDRAAGADLIVTNTFGAHAARLSQLGWAENAADLVGEAARLARAAARESAWVFGNIGGGACGDERDLIRLAEVLESAGVDALYFETLFFDQAARALSWIRARTRLGVVVSLVPEQAPPVSWRERGARLEALGASAVGLNCGSIASVNAALRELARGTSLPLLVKPALVSPAGEPESQAAPPWGSLVGSWIERGVRLIGACCGSTSADVACLRDAVDAAWPAPAP